MVFPALPPGQTRKGVTSTSQTRTSSPSNLDEEASCFFREGDEADLVKAALVQALAMVADGEQGMKAEQKMSGELAVWRRLEGRWWRLSLRDEGSRPEGNYSCAFQRLHLAELISISSDGSSGLDHNGG